jgi:hypothetical protein
MPVKLLDGIRLDDQQFFAKRCSRTTDMWQLRRAGRLAWLRKNAKASDVGTYFEQDLQPLPPHFGRQQ